MKQFAMTAAAAAAVMMMNPAFAADAAYEADLCVIGAGASGTAAAWAAAEKGMKVITLEKSGLPGGTGKYSEAQLELWSHQRRSIHENHELRSLARQCAHGPGLR